MTEFRTPIIDFEYSVYLQVGFSLLSATTDMMGSVFVSADSRKAFDKKYAMVDLFGTSFTACGGGLSADRLR